MASVLDGCRGVRSKVTTQLIVMPDDEYAFYLNEVLALPQKQQRKWKRQNEKTDGSTSTIRFDGQEFYTQWLNQRGLLKSQSMVAKLRMEHDAQPRCASFSEIENFQDIHAEMDRMQVETHTGNHTARHHPISAPTGAGQPVRG